MWEWVGKGVCQLSLRVSLGDGIVPCGCGGKVEGDVSAAERVWEVGLCHGGKVERGVSADCCLQYTHTDECRDL